MLIYLFSGNKNIHTQNQLANNDRGKTTPEIDDKKNKKKDSGCIIL